MTEITSDEFMQFKYIPFKKRVESMELYLIGSNGRKYNMEEVGNYIFEKKDSSFTVSLIHRCYNFSGQNGGRYKNGCRFEKMYGYRVTRKDIEDFVTKYPEGTFMSDITFEDFLKSKVSMKKADVSKDVFPIQVNTKENNSNNTNSSGNEETVLLIVAVVGILVLIILFLTGNLFKHWIISLVSGFFVYLAFSNKSEK